MLQAPAIVMRRAQWAQPMATYTYASNNPVSRIDTTGLLDYPEISCGDVRGEGYAPAASLPGKTACEDCARLKEVAKNACEAVGSGGSCLCDQLDARARKACFMCTVLPPPSKPQPRSCSANPGEGE